MRIDVFDILAVILGVWFTIRKLDAQSRQAKDFPHVEEKSFLDWRERETRVYLIASNGSFLYVIVSGLLKFVLAEVLPGQVLQILGATAGVSWLVLLIVTFFRSSAARKMRQRLQIHLGSKPGPGGWDEGSDDEGDGPLGADGMDADGYYPDEYEGGTDENSKGPVAVGQAAPESPTRDEDDSVEKK